MNINNVRVKTNFLVNSIQQGRFRNDRFNQCVYDASKGYYRKCLGLPEQADIDTLKTRFARTRVISADLNPFMKEVEITVPSSGIVPFPSGFPADYQLFEALWKKVIVKKNTAEHASACNGGTYVGLDGAYLVYNVPVIYKLNNRWAKRTSSSIVPPNKFKPIFRMVSNKIEFMPADIGKIKLVYLKKPVKPVWAYTVVNGVDVYDAANSIDLEWDELIIDEIANRAADIYLGNVKDLHGQQVVREKIAVGE